MIPPPPSLCRERLDTDLPDGLSCKEAILELDSIFTAYESSDSDVSIDASTSKQSQSAGRRACGDDRIILLQ